LSLETFFVEGAALLFVGVVLYIFIKVAKLKQKRDGNP